MNAPTPRATPGPTLLWRMTRPAFLLLTVVACVLGTATAAACGCGLDVPIPYNRMLEAAAVPQVSDIVREAKKLVA